MDDAAPHPGTAVDWWLTSLPTVGWLLIAFMFGCLFVAITIAKSLRV